LGQSGTVARPANRFPTKLFVVGDSFAEGTGSYGLKGVVDIIGRELGLEVVNLGSGSTGYLNTGTTGRFAIPDRVKPPFCSWRYHLGSIVSAGTYTLSFG